MQQNNSNSILSNNEHFPLLRNSTGVNDGGNDCQQSKMNTINLISHRNEQKEDVKEEMDKNGQSSEVKEFHKFFSIFKQFSKN